jgi:hypothetical protein
MIYSCLLRCIVEVSYVFKYPELRGRPGSEPWSIRQTGVLHQANLQSNSSSWMMLYPIANSTGYLRLRTNLQEPTAANELLTNPLSLHLLLIKDHFAKWRDYMIHYEAELLNMVGYIKPFLMMSD